MQIVLQQTFPLGRFHATPWKAFPYDDPHGEWPPSPWRLVRAVLARSYQLDREIAESSEIHGALREAMVRAFATSEVAWQLPPFTWRGPGLRQYQPAEFRRVPAGAKEPGMMAYNTTKVLDNFWITSNGGTVASPIIWVFEGSDWEKTLLLHLDACLARMTYFGRAESITEIQRAHNPKIDRASLTRLLLRRTGSAVPVLALNPDAKLSELEVTTDAVSVANTSIPPGSRWMYAERPQRPRSRPVSHSRPELPPVSLIQFAIGSTVAARYKDSVLITERFRNRVLGCFTKLLTGNPKSKWSETPDDVREQTLLLSGRSSNGSPLKDHRHAAFFLCGTTDVPSRLCVWRNEPFNDLEQRAILNAASTPLPLNYKNDPWTLTLLPLDKLVPPPPGLDGEVSRKWKTLTPYVPALHVFGRTGKEKAGCSVREQLANELVKRGFGVEGLVAMVIETGWVKTHRVRAEREQRTNSEKLGYDVRLEFSSAVKGPIFLGSSCHFGLGLFAPQE